MLRRLEVLRGVLVLRRVAAADVTASQAPPQRYPSIPARQTLLAPLGAGRLVVVGYEMRADSGHGHMMPQPAASAVCFLLQKPAGGLGVTGQLRALVIDDDVAIRLLVARVLERRRFLVDTARDGAEGIEKLGTAEYAVVVLDMMMPRVDGAGVMKYLATYHPAQLPFVIVMTAFGASALDRITPRPAHFLEKPFDVDMLVREVDVCVAAC
jgi:CheY-like chemotaxis protein